MIEAPPEPKVLLDLPQLFGRTAPVHVDLGCGDGSFLGALAAGRPNTNFLGIERLLHRVRASDRKARELDNVRIVRAETMFVLRRLLPAKSVEAFYLLFPDPWPKRRHHRRRLVTTGFLEAIAACLTTGGSLFIATDHDDYFGAIRRAFSNTVELAIADSDWNLPPTTFEKKFVATGTGIHRIEFRKVSPVT